MQLDLVAMCLFEGAPLVTTMQLGLAGVSKSRARRMDPWLRSLEEFIIVSHTLTSQRPILPLNCTVNNKEHVTS